MDLSKTLWIFHVLVAFILLLPNLCTCKIGGTELLINSNISKYSGLVGVDFNLTCKYDPLKVKKCDVRNLFFAGVDQKPLMPSENIKILNDSTIFYEIKNPPMVKGNYYCKCNIDGAPQILDLISVKIGTKPQRIKDEDFQCMSHQLKYFECNFKEPYNPVTTEYNVTFKTERLYHKMLENGSIIEKFLPQKHIYLCKLQLSGQKYTCNITLQDNSANYISSMNYYRFTINASNEFGSHSQEIRIKHNDLIVPSKPDLIVTNLSSNSVTFKWQKGVYQSYDLTCNLRYSYMNERKDNEDDFIPYPISAACDNKTQLSEIKLDLPYSHIKYDVRFSFKIRSAANDSKWWSEAYKTSILTMSRGPDRPPRTDMGSFFIDQKYVHLFWVKLSRFEENGPNFSYIINVKENDIDVDHLKPQKMNSYTAVFEKQSFLYSGLRSDRLYEFQIKSRNNISESEEYSVIRIPPMNGIKEEHMTELKKLRSGDHYILSWKSPKNVDDLINYTIFWCKTKQESLTECDGSIDFTYVDYVNTTQGEQNFTMIQNLDVLNFAISANYKDFSYGMSWAACTAPLDAELPPMVIQIKDQKPDSFVIHWNIECVHKSVLKGYNLTYCETDNNFKCIQNETMLNIPITKRYEYKMTNLKPYTNYLVKMAMYSEKNKGMMSKAATTTTLEAAPSEPRHLKWVKVTSSYAIISWEPPLHENGVIRSYTIHYGASARKISNQEFSDKFELKDNVITYRLDGLQNNHAYKVYVEAETVGETKSNSIYFNTWIGKPDAIQKVVRDPKNLDSHAYAWKKPSQNDGETSFYVVRVTVNNNDNIISYVTSNTCTLNLNLIDSCNGVSNYRLAVSAVNAIPKLQFDFEAFGNVDLDTNTYENKCNSDFLNNRRKRSISQATDLHTNISTEELCINPRSFQCLENIDSDKLNSKYSNSFFAQNELQDSDSFTCFHARDSDSNQPLFIIFAVIFALAVVVGGFSVAAKKLKKMKNIDFVLPPGLDDLNQDVPAQTQHNGNIDVGANEISSTPMSLEKTLMPHQISKKYQSSECLLPSSHDSGFPQASEFLSDKSNGFPLHDGFGSSEAPILDENSSTRSSSESVELSDICSSDSPIQVSNNIKRQNDISTVPVKPNLVKNPLASPIMANGYIQQSALQKPQSIIGIPQNGYTTLEALGKPTVPQHQTKLPINPSSNYIDTTNLQQLKHGHQNSIGIGGYVTHKQLSEFGQQRLQ